MQPYPFTFAFDSSGSADDIALPANFPRDNCIIKLKPPVGHAWTFVGANGVSYVLTTDEEITLGPMYAAPGLVIGAAILDSGSGTGKGIGS